MLERFRRKRILKQATGSNSYAKAKTYVRDKRISSIESEAGVVRAKVDGRFRNYWVSLLWQEDDRLASNCTCSEWQEKGICRHVVALGLHLIATNSLRKVSLEEAEAMVDEEEIAEAPQPNPDNQAAEDLSAEPLPADDKANLGEEDLPEDESSRDPEDEREGTAQELGRDEKASVKDSHSQ
ncbi:MAG: SWIM zinc finger family protein [Chromatiales bacterium]|nr:SWIM zinc finger family protein [Chromatiales bacterium]